MNLTIQTIYDKNNWSLTNDCIDWCREQHFINQSNLTIEAMFIPALALISLIIFQLIIIWHKQIIENTEITEDSLNKIAMWFSHLAIVLLMGFFVWFFWFR